VIGKVTRGSDIGHLVRYLFNEQSGSDKTNEHVDPRVVAADDALGVAVGVRLSKEEQARLGRGLDAPATLYGTEIGGGNVWHLSLATKAGVDRDLTDAEWADIAHETVRRLGFAGSGTVAPCRWVAVRHGRSATGNDHMHLAVNLVREGGRPASTSNDFRKVSAVCRDMEARYGLVTVEGRARSSGMPGVSRAEMEKARRVGRADPERVELARMVRAAALAARSEDEFVRRLRDVGLAAKPRYDRSGLHRVVGYSVAQQPADGGVAVFFAGGSLARDLRLPALRARWEQTEVERQRAAVEWGRYRNPEATSDEVAPGRWRSYDWSRAAGEWGPDRQPTTTGGPERTVFDARDWAEAAIRIGRVAARVAEVPVDDRLAWQAVAGDAAGLLAALSGRLEVVPGPIAKASDVLARSAQGRDTPSAAVRVPLQSRTVGRVAAVMAQAAITDEAAAGWQLMLTELLRLAQAIGRAHEARGEATQAALLAGEARAVLTQAHDHFASSLRVAELVPALIAEMEEATADRDGEDGPRVRRRKPAAAMRPEEYAAVAAKQHQTQRDPARGFGR
jgi:hypothetical protein